MKHFWEDISSGKWKNTKTVAKNIYEYEYEYKSVE